MRTLCAACLLVAAVAFGGTAEDLAEASTLLKSAEDEQAINVLTRALDRQESTPAERAQLYALVAIARANTHDEEGARLAFRRALEADASVEPSALASPKTRALFDEVRTAFLADQATAAAPKPTTVTKPTTASTPGQGGRRIGALVAGGAGVVAVGLGVALVGGGLSGREAAQQEPTASAAQARFAQANGAYVTGQVLLGVGVAALAAGATLYFWPTKTDAPSVTLVPGPGGVALVGRF